MAKPYNRLSRAARVIVITVITVKTVVKTTGKHMITVITGTISLYKYTPWGVIVYEEIARLSQLSHVL